MNCDLVVEGYVNRIIYPSGGVKEAGTFAIFSFSITDTVSGEIDNRVKDKWYKEGFITLKGSVPELSGTTKYRICANVKQDKKYGYGYEIQLMNVCADLDNQDGLRKFLSYVLTSNQIECIFETLKDPLTVLENHDSDALCSVKGIGFKTAQKIFEKFDNSKDNSSAYSVLYDFGLTKRMIDKLISQYKSSQTLIDKLRRNPYSLIDDCDGIGWAKADAMALKSGIPHNSEFRIEAYIKYYLKTLAEVDGHTWVPLESLVSNVKGLTSEISNDMLKKILRNLLESETLYYEKDTRRVGLSRYRRLEENICRELIRIRDASTTNGLKFIDETIDECEETVGFKYTEEQRQAIKDCVNNNVFLLTALAGCGKSTLMYPVTRIFRKNGLSFAQCALSGKASLNLRNITNEDGKTIHRLLGWTPEGFVFNSKTKLGYDAIILDEISMVGGELFYSLISAIKDGAKLIMIGDPGQLESIGLCNLISDIRNSSVIARTNLTKIFRQAEMSGIITDSIKIYNQQPIIGKYFLGTETHGELKDFEIYSRSDKNECRQDIINLYKKIHFKLGAPTDEIVVATAKRCSGGLSSAELNTEIQKCLTFDDDGPVVRKTYVDNNTTYEITYHVGDRVIVTENAYDTVDCESGESNPVFNGNLGTIREIRNKEMIVEFPQGNIVIPSSMLSSIQLGYAITTHKSQGSGFKYVISVCDPGAFNLLTKEFLYTSITRAKYKCYLIGTPYSINTCIKTTRVVKKQTWLCELLMRNGKV